MSGKYVSKSMKLKYESILCDACPLTSESVNVSSFCIYIYVYMYIYIYTSESVNVSRFYVNVSGFYVNDCLCVSGYEKKKVNQKLVVRNLLVKFVKIITIVMVKMEKQIVL